MGFRSDSTLNAARETIREYPQLTQRISHNQLVLQELERKLLHLAGQAYFAIPQEIVAEKTIREQELCGDEIKKVIFELAWQNLSENEQIILETFLWRDLKRKEAVDQLMTVCYCSESTVDRRYIKALRRMQRLLDIKPSD